MWVFLHQTLMTFPFTLRAMRHDVQGERGEASLRLPRAEASSPEPQTRPMSSQETRRVNLVEYSSGYRMARYWSTPARMVLRKYFLFG